MRVSIEVGFHVFEGLLVLAGTIQTCIIWSRGAKDTRLVRLEIIHPDTQIHYEVQGNTFM